MTEFLPVGVGGDIGVYALLRAFHEQYGTPAVALSSVATRAMTDSTFVTNVVVPGIDDAAVLVTALEEVAAAHPGVRLVLLTNADWYVRAIIENRERLEKHYLVPFCSLDVLDVVSSKESFAAVCARLDIPTPREVPVDVADLTARGGRERIAELEVDLDFPVVAKPSSSAEYHYISFPGKRKIHHVATRAELDELLGHLVDAGYTGTFLVQEFIPGDETQMRSLTAYRDSHGDITLLATGRVLLEEHTPGTLGIPAAILTEQYEDAMEAASRFLDEVGYLGFANFDYKWDPRTGRHVYFEMNPRIGRNNYYVTAAGANPARVLVEDQVHGNRIKPVRASGEVLYTVVPVRLLMRYILEPGLRSRLRAVVRRGAVVNPLSYSRDGGLRRRATVWAMTMNFYRKYKTYYPKPTETGY
ncbi:carboxylate--amine ligase [Sanguibacter suarezii]|uniref:carboxylate--amine ligase n=1 Tax=Sanguibacter suarezii TaxID=60921 RepID=UPI00082A1DD8|nr:carboxylate--amine ligase [Sanguibacter suarezii]